MLAHGVHLEMRWRLMKIFDASSSNSFNSERGAIHPLNTQRNETYLHQGAINKLQFQQLSFTASLTILAIVKASYLILRNWNRNWNCKDTKSRRRRRHGNCVILQRCLPCHNKSASHVSANPILTLYRSIIFSAWSQRTLKMLGLSSPNCAQNVGIYVKHMIYIMKHSGVWTAWVIIQPLPTWHSSQFQGSYGNVAAKALLFRSCDQIPGWKNKALCTLVWNSNRKFVRTPTEASSQPFNRALYLATLSFHRTVWQACLVCPRISDSGLPIELRLLSWWRLSSLLYITSFVVDHWLGHRSDAPSQQPAP